ncbi:MAG: hypothetical protein ABR503_04675 [Chitinophagaceae bacterium]
MKIFLLFAFASNLTIAVHSQQPFRNHREAVDVRYSSSQPVIHYTLRIDTSDLSLFYVTMNIRNVKDTFHLAMVTHPEYDDRYWRFVEQISVKSKNTSGGAIREDSALWRITTSGNEAIINYRVHFHPRKTFRAAWRPFLTSKGGLFGGPHSFMYVVGATLASSHVIVEIPQDWKIATGLIPTSDPKTFFASTVSVLVESPIMIGSFKSWSFSVDGVPHQVAYWPLSSTSSFDSTALLANMQGLVQQAALLFGRLTYRDYSFMLLDSSWGGLEHNNSVTLGAPVNHLQKDMRDFLGELSHEYFHTWNLMRIHPVEYGDVSYKKQKLSRGLWWSEGLTMFYADLLLRRGNLPVYDSSRTDHLETLLKRYFYSAGYYRVSAEKVSEAAYGKRDMLGDYNASTHGQGEVIGSMLDIIVRNATNGRRTIDDVMRKMMEKYSGEKGFTSSDIETVVEEVCGCNVTPFFNAHVKGAGMIDFDKYLAMIGLKKTLSWVDALMDDGRPALDLRTYAYQDEKDTTIYLAVMDPESIWGKAGLHTGYHLISINDKPIRNTREYRMYLGEAKMGDRLSIKVKRPSGLYSATVVMSGYKQPKVIIEEMPVVTEKQKRLRKQWMEGY